MIITIEDIRRAGHCVSGTRAWFSRQNLDFRDFLKNGISAEKFLATGCAYAERIVRMKVDQGGQ